MVRYCTRLYCEFSQIDIDCGFTFYLVKSDYRISSCYRTSEKFQLIEGTMLLMIVPIAYVCLKFLGIRPEYVFVVHILVEICTQYARLRIVLPMINMNLVDYFRRVVKPILFVVVLSPILPYVIYNNLNEGYVSFFIECSICVLCSSMVIYSVGCTCSERIFIKGKIFELINKVRNRN